MLTDVVAADIANLREDVAELFTRATPEQGPKGEKGEPGAKGEKGDRGPKGEPGEDGRNGTVWTVGVALPDDAQGVDGDLYLRSNGDVYERITGHYEKRFNLKGPQGDRGVSNWWGGGGGTGTTPGSGMTSWQSQAWS
jgi:hypothetical protein